MAERYFEKFPTITYLNNQVLDITKRTALLNRVSDNPYIFYPYEITSNERADQFSYSYYGDQYQSWIVYLTNKITDPYYEWYMSEDEFIEFLDKKYGSYVTAQEKVAYYKNDWESSEPIAISTFNSLIPNNKKYWEPVYNTGSNIREYKRKAEDWTINTNKIVSYSVSNTIFIKNEICQIVFNQDNIGIGQVTLTTNNSVYLQHLSGSFFPSNTNPINSNSYIYGTESNVNTVFTAATSIANNLLEEELIYWKPVTYFEHELNKNEYNKTIRILDKDLSQTASNNLRDLLREE
jgi:hypothetical protein